MVAVSDVEAVGDEHPPPPLGNLTFKTVSEMECDPGAMA